MTLKLILQLILHQFSHTSISTHVFINAVPFSFLIVLLFLQLQTSRPASVELASNSLLSLRQHIDNTGYFLRKFWPANLDGGVTVLDQSLLLSAESKRLSGGRNSRSRSASRGIQSEVGGASRRYLSVDESIDDEVSDVQFWFFKTFLITVYTEFDLPERK